MDRDDSTEAQSLAERLAAGKELATDDWGGPDFILGVLAARAAETSGGKQRAESFRLASLYLARSQERGFPAGRQSAGLYLLGKSLWGCGRLHDALPALEQALPQNAQRATEIRAMLIEARMATQPPQCDKALAESRKLLSGPRLAESERRRALVQQAEILLRMHRIPDCAAAVDKLRDDPLLRCEVSLLRGRLAMAEGQALKKPQARPDAQKPSPAGRDTRPPRSGATQQASAAALPKRQGDRENASAEKFRIAVEWFRKALNQDLGDNRVASQATYFIGLCLVELDDLPAALNQMERAAKRFPERPSAGGMVPPG